MRAGLLGKALQGKMGRDTSHHQAPVEHPVSVRDGVRCSSWGVQGLQGAMVLILARREFLSLRLPTLAGSESLL